MDNLGIRIIADEAKAASNRARADKLEQMARILRDEANEIERLLELARLGPVRQNTPQEKS